MNNPSAHSEQPGLIEERLKPCPNTPNCINTEFPENTDQYMPALDFPDSKSEQIMTMAKKVIIKMGGQVVTENNNYLSATFTSSIFRFVDDFEIRKDNSSKKLHIRSASRVGYSDFGVNKRRVEKFYKLFKNMLR